MLTHRSADCLFSLPGLEYTYDHLEHDLDGRTMMLHVKCAQQSTLFEQSTDICQINTKYLRSMLIY